MAEVAKLVLVQTLLTGDHCYIIQYSHNTDPAVAGFDETRMDL